MASVKTDVMANLAGALAPIAIALATVPFYLRAIGPERFGVISIVWVFVGYFGLLDFGLSRAAVHRMARSDGPEKSLTYWSGVWAAAGFGTVAGALVFLLAVPGYLHYARFPAGLHDEFLGTSAWIGLAAALVPVNAVCLGALEVERRFVLANWLQVIGVLATQGLPLLAALLIAPTLGTVLPTMVLGRLATTVLIGIASHRILGLRRPERMQWSIVRGLFLFGGWIGVSSLVSPLLSNIDQLVIGARLGPSVLPHYSVPSALAIRINVIPSAVIRSIFPSMARRFGHSGDTNEQRFWLPLVVVMTAVCATGVAVFPTFLSVWLGAAFAENSAVIGQILIVAMWFNSLAYLLAARLQAMARPDIAAKLHLFEIPPYLSALYLGLTYLGLLGAALAWAFRTIMDFILLFIAAGYGPARAVEALPGLVLIGLAFALSYLGGGVVFAGLLGLGFAGATAAWGLWALPDLRDLAASIINRSARP